MLIQPAAEILVGFSIYCKQNYKFLPIQQSELGNKMGTFFLACLEQATSEALHKLQRRSVTMIFFCNCVCKMVHLLQAS